MIIAMFVLGILLIVSILIMLMFLTIEAVTRDDMSGPGIATAVVAGILGICLSVSAIVEFGLKINS